jgi:hypothetical protein
VARRLVAQAVGDADPTAQRGSRTLGQLKGDQRLVVNEGHLGQRQGIDGVGLGVADQELAQVRRLGGRHPIDQVTAADEVDGDGQPGRSGRFHRHRELRVGFSTSEGCLLECAQRLESRSGSAFADHSPGAVNHACSVGRGDTEIDADDAGLHGTPPLARFDPTGRDPHLVHGPKESQGSVTAPTHVLQPGPGSRPHPRLYPGPPWPNGRGKHTSGATPLGRPQWLSCRPLPDQPGSQCNPFAESRSSVPVLTCGCFTGTGGKKKVTSVGVHGGLDARLGAALAEPEGGCVPCITAPAKYMAYL